MNMDNEIILQRYLDGDLSGEQERKALHIIADDSEMREMLAFERNLRANISQSHTVHSPNVPANFADKVMHHIEEIENPEKSPSPVEKFKKWLKSWWTPKTLQFRPVYGVAFALVLLVFIGWPIYLNTGNEVVDTNQNITESVQQVSDTGEQVWVRFVYIDKNAESVELAGDFNGWEPEPLEKQEVNGEQVWTGLISMNRGEHRYMFVKDGEKWVTDPMAPLQREDGFGNKNAVIYL